VAFQRTEPSRTGAAPTQGRRLTPGGVAWQPAESTGGSSLRLDPSRGGLPELIRWPGRLSREALHLAAYPLMLLARRLDERLLELFQKGYVKGTVTSGVGNEATAMAALPLRAGRDVVSLLHRDLAAHLLLGATPHELLCQYLANAESPTHGREGNVHHGDAARRRFPMMSHLGRMLSLVVGGVWAARRAGEEVFGLAVIGDGGSSTGEFHEAINLASVRRAPVLFLVENNHYAFSTPTSAQYHCRRLSDRAAGYGVTGRTIDGTDPWEVYAAVHELLCAMRDEPAPALLECMTLRLHGHAAYDKGLYVPAPLLEQWRQADPLPRTRGRLRELCGLSEAEVASIDAAVEAELREAVAKALAVARPQPPRGGWRVYAGPSAGKGNGDAALPGAAAVSAPRRVEPFAARGVKNGDAVRLALEYILTHNPAAFLAGQDIGVYGSAFKTCKGLIDRFGAERVIDMPLAESAMVGFALGASQTGGQPIVEFQFADFSTEAATQLGLNAGSWFFRSGAAAPLLLRLPCGGGLTVGAFHSGEYEGLWARFPGLKLLYPATPQETFEALLAGFYDPNPCLVFEHKLLYWSGSGDIDFDGDLAAVWRPRRWLEGSDLTLVAFGAMAHQAAEAAARSGRSVDLWNPLVLQPLDLAPIFASIRRTGRLLVVQEAGQTRGLGDRIIALAAGECFSALRCGPRLLAAPDVPMPFAAELETCCRPDAPRIAAAIAQLMEEAVDG
jgi:2-oxoisovalerate dehydrogenase E1 component